MDDLVLFQNGRKVGLIAPSTLYAHYAEQVYINGPEGIARLEQNDELGLSRALGDAGSVIEGSETEIEAVLTALRDPVTSRTTSYFLCTASSCSEVIEHLQSIRSANMVIAGCGGIGSAVALMLAGCGIRQFTLVDPDIIEKSNLNRQFFFTLNDIGTHKVVALTAAMKDRYEGLNISTFIENVSIEQLKQLCASEVSALAVTADNPGTLASESRQVAAACKIPVIGGGYLHDTMMLFSYLPDKLMHPSPHETAGVEWERLPNSIMPSYGPMNLALASEIASRIIAALSGKVLSDSDSAVYTWKMIKHSESKQRSA